MDRVLDEHFGPERPEEQSGPIRGEAAKAVEADARVRSADPGRATPSLPVTERLLASSG